MIKTKRGLDLPIAGSPKQQIEDGPVAREVALVGYDYPGLKPTMEVAEGDRVVAGQLVFTCKKSPGIKYTSPASGTVARINRGPKRVFESLVIDVDGDDTEGADDRSFPSYSIDQIKTLARETVVTSLIDSGQWTAFRARPYSKVPLPVETPEAIFVTASDTRPLSADPGIVIREEAAAYLAGIEVLTRLTEGRVFVCSSTGVDVPMSENPQVQNEQFAGPHPSGNAGTHIHFLHPVHTNRTVWHVGYQDVIAIGHLFTTGKLHFGRVVALAGPGVSNPRLIRTRLGASIDELAAGELEPGNQRLISGSVLDGRRAADATSYIGRFHNQVSALPEGTERELLEFIRPGPHKFSLTRLFISAFTFKKEFDMTTSTYGSPRSIIPLGTYEEVMPLDILPTQLLRALVTSDFDASIELGCLELDEEDLALCTFACPGKYEYGPYLRHMLNRIEAES